MFRYQSLEDCPLDEDDEAYHNLAEEDEDIDQFNDDTFGAGAVDDDWQEAHERLAEMEEKPASAGEQVERGVTDEMDLLGDHEENLAERLSKMVIDNELEDPAIMQAVQTRPLVQHSTGLNSSIWDGPSVLRRIRGPLLNQEVPSVSVLEYALPQRPPQAQEEEQDVSERALPRRSSSPVIGSPPVRAVPIGTPPKQPSMPNFNQQILCPKPVHIRVPIQQRYPSPFSERMSPNQLCNVTNSSLLGHPFPPSVTPVLTHLQRAQLLGGAQAGRMSPSQFARVSGLVSSPLASMNPKLLQGRVGQMIPPASGFRAFFGAPPAPSQHHSPCPGAHLQNLRPQPQMFRPDTTHLHPQHRRLLHQRQQQNRSQHRNLNGSVGDRGNHRNNHQEQIRKDPYANLMLQREKDWVSKIQMMQLQSTDPYLDDFYYQNYFQKLEKLSAAEDMHGDGPKKERTKLITPQVAKLEHAYKPVQFEGSLGKLTVSSVNNPRKMIDAVVTLRGEEDETKEKQVRDKRRQTLVMIEKTYSLLLDVEDYERRYLLSLEGDRLALMEERKQKICDMYDNLRGKTSNQESKLSDDPFVQIMCIRKGKRLVGRILPFLSTEQAANVLMATARNLPFLIKKDAQDEVLPCLLRPFSLVLYHLPLGTVACILQQLMNLPQSTTAAPSANQHLTAVLQNKFGLSLLYLVLSRGEELQNSDSNTEHMQDNQWADLMFMATRELLRIPQAALAKPVTPPSNLLSLFSRYVDRQKLNVLETKLQLIQGIR
ncbi:protein PAT1 homolog 1 isoform X1 [Anolis carolinensis]|uniref:Protein PAT1 homolog 1 n=1 Tax=Anolis carolinensis TaxID=28377 RepID=G1KFK1_ANOCA|nr:PREDICTED: protein PAT1 homolog 1 isoform X1 [Anolis carolinensis]|eukprot:XP_008108913.1 PREDICTED: protein PAT1 homolog 1 isoform X1 [Anolis carolinensis]